MLFYQTHPQASNVAARFTHGQAITHSSAGCAQVLAEARRLKFHSVRGNHDDEALAAYEAFARGKHVPGGKKWVKDLPAAAAQWLHALPFSLRIPSYGVTVVHAGIVPDVRLGSFLNNCIFVFSALQGMVSLHKTLQPSAEMCEYRMQLHVQPLLPPHHCARPQRA